MTEQTQRWTVHLPPEYRPAMESCADDNNRTLLGEVVTALDQYLGDKSPKKKSGKKYQKKVSAS